MTFAYKLAKNFMFMLLFDKKSVPLQPLKA